jgi:predicted permease
VNGVLLNPLPFPQPNQLVMMYEKNEEFQRSSISYPNFKDWQRENTTFAAMASYRTDDRMMTGTGDTMRVHVGMTGADFFSILGVKPVMGRLFSADDDRLGAAGVTLISYGLWQRKFGGDPGVVGKRITMDGDDFTIIGVIPASFNLDMQNFHEEKDAYVPVGQWKQPLFQERKFHMGMDAIARLKPGVSIDAARADMEGIAERLAVLYPEADAHARVNVQPLKADMVRQVSFILWVLLVAVAFVLLIACVNVANLQLARSTGRVREFAIRSAMGASQGRVIRQLLTESVMVGLAGGVLGCLLAAWGTGAAIRALPETLPRAQDVGIDGRVLLFTLGISILAGLVFGLAPAFKTAQPNLQETLKEGGRGGSGVKQKALSVFVVSEMALALVLLIGAGLMIRSLVRLWDVNPGFESGHVLTFMASLAAPQMDPEAQRAAIRAFDEKVKSVPGVEAVASIAGSLPLANDDEERVWAEGQPTPSNESEMSYAVAYYVEPEYGKAMGIHLLRGRFLNSGDVEGAQQVAVVDEKFAEKFFPGQDPIGKVIHVPILKGSPVIVGVVSHVKQWGLDSSFDGASVQEEFYYSMLQLPDWAWNGPLGDEVVVKTSGAPSGVEEQIRRAATELNGQDLVFQQRTMDEIIAGTMAARRFAMILLCVFAGLALVLSSIGIFGVISYVVGQRTHEIGIRMAMGAQRRDVLHMLLGEGMKMALIGVGIGVVAALGLTRLMVKILFGVSAADPGTFVAVTVILTCVALSACYLPSRRAMRVSPMEALRYE